LRAVISRLAVALASLPIVLGLAWIGAWPLVALTSVAALLALHELYRATRAFRPLVLAGYAGAVVAFVGLQLGGIEWLALGLLVALTVAFVFAAFAETSASSTAALAITTFGVLWIVGGLAHLVLIRETAVDAMGDHRGRLAIFTVLIAVFATDTAAYVVGRLVGRRKLIPRLSPGKTWEGFLGGAVAGVFATWVANYKEGYLDNWEAVVLGLAIVAAATVGDLFESMIKRDVGVKDTGTLLGGHGGVLDRIDSLLLAGPVAFYVLLAFDAVVP